MRDLHDPHGGTVADIMASSRPASDFPPPNGAPPGKANGAAPGTKPAPDFAALLTACRVSPTGLESPPVVFSIERDGKSYPFAMAGAIVGIIGKAKSRKTGFVKCLAAAPFTPAPVLGCIKSHLLPDAAVLYFDTEQGGYWSQTTLQSILRLAEKPFDQPPANLHYFDIRRLSPSDRRDFISYTVANTPNIGAVIVDGARDLVDSINDEKEATDFFTWVFSLPGNERFATVLALHQNKSEFDSSPRGHIGTELLNKGEAVVSVTRDKQDKRFSIVRAEYCRGEDFPQFAFTVDEHNTPTLAEDFEPSGEREGDKPTRPNTDPSNFELETHKEVLQNIKRRGGSLKYADLHGAIRAEFEAMGIRFGRQKAEHYLKWYEKQRFVSKPEKGWQWTITV